MELRLPYPSDASGAPHPPKGVIGRPFPRLSGPIRRSLAASGQQNGQSAVPGSLLELGGRVERLGEPGRAGSQRVLDLDPRSRGTE